MSTLDALVNRLQVYMAPDEINRIKRAYFYAEQAHDGQARRTGDRYISHPLAVATILAQMHMDHESLMAAMLHDVLEDTVITKADLSQQFGAEVAELVDGVSRLTHLDFETKQEEQAENFQKMVFAMSKDIRVILVKLADRLHNMRTLGVMPPEKKRRKARETLDIYTPIALRLGINDLRIELENLAFQSLYPLRAQRIAKAIANNRGHRKALVDKIRKALAARLTQAGVEAKVIGREKHLHSIYSKMKHQRKSLQKILDVYGFRIIANSIDECYRILGIMHNFYKPIPNRFKDYIAIPKANGYQSLHTALIGSNGVPIEIQIRTQEMEEMANQGIAAHWFYKRDDLGFNHPSHARARRWVKGLLEMQERAGDSLEFIESVKMDLFPDEIYLFTPKGHILEMPKGATPIDFAYAVHTDVGNSCVGCYINRQIASLSQPLESGSTVKIITAEGAKPNPAWLNFATTAKARSNIRHFLQNLKQQEAIELGTKLLNTALKRFNITVADLPEASLKATLDEYGLAEVGQLLEALGLGNKVPFMVARHLLGHVDSDREQHNEDVMTVSQSEGLLLNYANCCRPIPGDPILGMMSKDKGLVIHTETCRNIAEQRKNVNNWLPLHWDKSMEGEFYVDLRLEVDNARGILASVANSIAQTNANVDSMEMLDKLGATNRLNLTVAVTGRVHLGRIIRRLHALKAVNKIERVQS